MYRRCLLPALILGFAAVSSAPLCARDWIVDDDGSADFRSIQAAVDASSPGDRIFVLMGRYRGFSCAKGVALIAMPYGRQELTSDVSIHDLPATQRFVIHGLTFDRDAPPSIRVTNCRGGVVLADLQYPTLVFGAPFDQPLIDIDSSDDVMLTRITSYYLEWAIRTDTAALRIVDSRVDIISCEIVGFTGDTGQDGSAALSSSGASVVTLADSSLTGGRGGEAAWGGGDGGNGGPAAEVLSGELRIIGSPTDVARITGGLGGRSSHGMGGDGGDGLHVADAARVELSRTVAEGGAGGTGGQGNGARGEAIIGDVDLAEPARPVLSFTSRAVAGRRLNHALGGEPGATGIDMLALGSAALEADGIDGILRLDPTRLVLIRSVVLGADGTKVLGVDLPRDGTLSGLALFQQAFLDPDGSGPIGFVLTNVDVAVIAPL